MTVPIEEVLEETITTSLAKSEESVKKKVKLNKKRKEKFKKQEDFVEVIKKDSRCTLQDKTDKSGNKNTGSISDDDDNFSFLPIIEKNKKKRVQISPEKLEVETKQVVAKSNSKSNNNLKSIKNYKSIKNPKHQAKIESLPVVTRRFSDSFEKVQNFVVINRLEEKPIIEIENILKESKKVTSSISYANIVLNNYQTTNKINEVNSSEDANCEVSSSGNLKKSVTVNSGFSNSPYSSNLQESFIKLDKPEENTSDFVDLSTSSSDSIAVLEPSTSTHLKGEFEIFSELNFSNDLKIICENSLLKEQNTSLSINLSETNFCSKETLSTPLKTNENLVAYLNSSEKPVENSCKYNRLDEKCSESSSISVIDYQDFISEKDIIGDLLDDVSAEKFSIEYDSVHVTKQKDIDTNSESIEENPVTFVNNKAQRPTEIFRTETTNILLNSQNKNILIQKPRDQDYLLDKLNTIHLDQELKGSIPIQSTDTNKNIKTGFIKKQESLRLYLENMSQIRVLTLNDKEHQECTLYRLEKNWTLQFRIGPSLFGRTVFLYCNYPIDGNSFIHNKYHLIPWELDEGCKHSDDTAAFANISVKLAGSFHYFFTFTKK